MARPVPTYLSLAEEEQQQEPPQWLPGIEGYQRKRCTTSCALTTYSSGAPCQRTGIPLGIVTSSLRFKRSGQVVTKNMQMTVRSMRTKSARIARVSVVFANAPTNSEQKSMLTSQLGDLALKRRFLTASRMKPIGTYCVYLLCDLSS